MADELNNITPITPGPYAHLWEMANDKAFDPDRRPYLKTRNEPSDPVSFRIPSKLKREIDELLAKQLIPGIVTLSDFLVDAVALSLERIDGMELPGMQHFSATRKLQRQRQLNQDRLAFLEETEDTLDVLIKERDLQGMQDLLDTLHFQQNRVTTEPKSYQDKLAKHVDRVVTLIKEAQE